MGRPVCKFYVERDQEIVRRYTEDGKTLSDLGDEFGLSKVRIKCILVAHNVSVRHEPRKKQHERRPQHNSLVAMGARIHSYRIKEGLSLAECALKLGLSEVRLTDALQGLYNWKFSEMVRVAQVTGYLLSDFVKPPQGLSNG